jgi:pimeloyl-ACP methyl ester carboxylesterase
MAMRLNQTMAAQKKGCGVLGQSTLEPASHYHISQRLKLHYVDWGNPDKPLLALIHGTGGHARSWDWVARALRDDYHVVAPDLRGHGDSEWARGSRYSMVEYVADLDQLLTELDAFPVTLIGHSVGGGIVLQYSGVCRDKVAKLVAIEGLGPPHRMNQDQNNSAHEQTQEWITQMRNLAGRQPRRYKTLDEAAQRLREVNARLSQEQAGHLALHGTKRNEDGTYAWKFDAYVNAMSAYPSRVEDTRDVWSRITCPVLLIRGADSKVPAPEKDDRIRAFLNAQTPTVPNAGHWVHQDQPEDFLEVVREFLDRPDTSSLS